MKKQFTLKLTTSVSKDIYFLKISPPGKIELRNATNKVMPPDWLSGANTAEVDLMIAAALADDADDAEIERRLLKIISTYYPPVWQAKVFSAEELLA